MKYTVEILNNSNIKIGELTSVECEAKIHRILNGEWNISLTYPLPPVGQGEDKSDLLYSPFARLKVLNLNDVTDCQAFVIEKLERFDEGGTKYISINGTHIFIHQLISEIVPTRFLFKEVPINFALSKILSYTSNWTLGTCNTTRLVSVDVGHESIFSAFQKIIESASVEWDVNEQNSTINIANTIGSDNSVHIRPGKNLISYSDSIYSREIVNKIYGVGSGEPPVTLAGTWHEIYSSDGTTVTINHNKIVPETGCWNPVDGNHKYGLEFKTGVNAGTVATIATSTSGLIRDSFTLLSPLSGISFGDRVVLVETLDNFSSWQDVNYLHSPSSIQTYGAIEAVHTNQNYTDAINLVEEPALDGTYTNGICRKWGLLMGTVATLTENTDPKYIQYGTKSQKVVTFGDGHGIYQSVNVTQGAFYTVTAWVYIVSGTIRFYINSYFIDLSGKTGWQRIEVKNGRAGSNLFDIVISQFGAQSATFYLDAVQVTQTTEPRDFVKNCSRINLWFEAYDKLMLNLSPKVIYRCNFVDLYKIDNVVYEDDKISLGDTVKITDEKLGINQLSARVKEVSYMPFRQYLTEHTVTNI